MKLAKYKLIFDKVKMYTKKENTILKTRYGNTGIISLSLGGGICNYDVVKEHSDYLLSMAGNPVKSFSILTGRDSRY